MTAAVAVAFTLRWKRIGIFWPYITAGGALSWTVLFRGGVDAPPGAHDP
jgi:hypothetical protein